MLGSRKKVPLSDVVSKNPTRAAKSAVKRAVTLSSRDQRKMVKQANSL